MQLAYRTVPVALSPPLALTILGNELVSDVQHTRPHPPASSTVSCILRFVPYVVNASSLAFASSFAQVPSSFCYRSSVNLPLSPFPTGMRAGTPLYRNIAIIIPCVCLFPTARWIAGASHAPRYLSPGLPTRAVSALLCVPSHHTHATRKPSTVELCRIHPFHVKLSYRRLLLAADTATPYHSGYISRGNPYNFKYYHHHQLPPPPPPDDPEPRLNNFPSRTSLLPRSDPS